ncbi:hypothetical protein MNBD_GAMMA12-3061 [hydrothermal vent metagenome]|uniref:ImpA N-terminal domain-containing protein n=1 Tax=hydrothermal vent metagenome TaxID=652676 RepID=A0A3B0Y1Z7_9ZZZZ
MSTTSTELDASIAGQGDAILTTDVSGESSQATGRVFSSPWVSELCMPIEGEPASDPRYGDNYVDIKTEIDKLSGSDYPRIFKLSKKILQEEAKDLRVAGYLLLSSTHKFGLEGLINGLEIYKDLLERYWDNCFPKADIARASAISWLNNNKISFFLQRDQDDLSQETLDSLKELLGSFNALIDQRVGDQAQSFTVLNQWIETAQLRVNEYSQQQEQERVRIEQLEQERLAHEKQLALLEELQTDEKERGEQVCDMVQRLYAVEAHKDIAIEELCSHLHNNNQMVQAVMHARAQKWSFVKISPEMAAEVTDITFPEGLEFENILTLDDPAERLKACEELFVLPGAEFCFKLQMIATQSAKDMYDKVLLKTLKQQVGDLLDKFPELMDKAYADGTAFADEECKDWLQDIVSSRSEISPLAAIANQSGKAEELDLALQEAKEIVVNEDLNAGIKYISNLAVTGELGRVKQKLNMALLCSEQGRSDLALPVLDELFASATRNKLHIWQPELAMVLWQALYSVLLAEKEKSNDFFKEKIEHKLKEISEMMCTADLSMASQLLNQ